MVPMPHPLHLGALHPIEQALTLLLAFGPFAVLGIVIWLRRKEDRAVAEGDSGSPESSSHTTQESGRADLSG